MKKYLYIQEQGLYNSIYVVCSITDKWGKHIDGEEDMYVAEAIMARMLGLDE